MGTFGSQMHISKHLVQQTFRLQPRFTIVHHPVRQKFALSLTTYAVIDSVHQLSHRPDHPWCSQSKLEMAKFLDVSERQVFRAIKEGLEKELIEKNDVVIYEPPNFGSARSYSMRPSNGHNA